MISSPTRWLARCALAAAACLPLAGPAFAAPAPIPADLSTWGCTGACGGSAADGDIGLSPFGSARYGFVGTAGSLAVGVSPLHLDSNSRGNGTETNGSRWLSPSFQAVAGDTLAMQFNYVSTDGKGFDDYAWARVVNAADSSLVAWLFTARSSNSNTGKIVPGDVVDQADFDPDAVIVDFKDFRFHSKSTDDPVNWSPLGASNGTCWRDNAPGCGHTGWLQSRINLAAAGSYRVEVGVVNWGDEAYDSGLAFDLPGLSAPVPEPGALALWAAGGALLVFSLRQRRPLVQAAKSPRA